MLLNKQVYTFEGKAQQEAQFIMNQQQADRI
jgi:hypothetical protein